MFFRGKKDKEKEKDEEEKLESEAPKKSRRAEKKEEDELIWDKKRVVIAFLLIFFILFGLRQAKGMFFPNVNILGESTVKKASEIDKPEVDGPGLGIESNVSSKFEDIKDNIVNLDPEEVASSSPQIQKVLHDIQGIKDLPADQARNTCMKICSGI
jgi:hypothetical protein